MGTRVARYWMVASGNLANKRISRLYASSSRSLSRSVSTKTANVHRGTAFEDRSLHVLQQHMSMSLTRVGGKEDGGIDLLGWWWIPHESPTASAVSLFKRRRMRVIGQCKAEKKKMGPNYVRELEGVLFRFFAGDTFSEYISSRMEDEPEDDSIDRALEFTPGVTAIALLISQSPFTKSTILRANSSPIPFCLLHIPKLDEPANSEEDFPDQPCEAESPGKVGVAWCNPALLGLPELKGRMEVRWKRRSGETSGYPALWWDGNPLPSWTPGLMQTQ